MRKGSIQFQIELAHFGEGAFRYAYKAISSSPEFSDGSYVVKRYKKQHLTTLNN